MSPGGHRCPAVPRRRLFWWLLIPLAPLFTFEPGLTLVLTAIGLSALAFVWIVLLIRFLIVDALGTAPSDAPPR